jgi:hypothetical protein
MLEPDVAAEGGDTPLALTERLLYMSAIKQRAAAAWDAAKDVGGRGARCALVLFSCGRSDQRALLQGRPLCAWLSLTVLVVSRCWTARSGLVRHASKDAEADKEAAGMMKLTGQLMTKRLDSMTIEEATLMVKTGHSEQEMLKGLRALARQATHGTAEQAHIASSGSFREAVICMKENMGSAAIQQAGCVLMVNLARHTSTAGYDESGAATRSGAQQQHSDLVLHAADQAAQSEDPPWLRRHIVDAGGLDVMLGVGNEIGCMEAYCNNRPDDDAVGVQHCACAALYNLAFDAAITPELEARGAIAKVIHAMKEFPTSAQVRMMQDYAADEEAHGLQSSPRLGELGEEGEDAEAAATDTEEQEQQDEEDEDDDAEDEDEEDEEEEEEETREEAAARVEREDAEALAVQRAEEQAAGRVEIQAYCCAVLQNFSAHAAHEKAVRDAGAIGCIINALRAHPHSAQIQLHGLSALCNLSSDPSSRCGTQDSMAERGAALYAEAARHHFAPMTKRLALPTPYALGIARTRLREVVSFHKRLSDAEFNDAIGKGSGRSLSRTTSAQGRLGWSASGMAQKKTGEGLAGSGNVVILPEGSLENVRPEAIPHALDNLEAPAVIVLKSGAGNASFGAINA